MSIGLVGTITCRLNAFRLIRRKHCPLPAKMVINGGVNNDCDWVDISTDAAQLFLEVYLGGLGYIKCHSPASPFETKTSHLSSSNFKSQWKARIQFPFRNISRCGGSRKIRHRLKIFPIPHVPMKTISVGGGLYTHFPI